MKSTTTTIDDTRYQQIFDLFSESCSEILRSSNLEHTIQLVKGALHDRDYSRAFDNQDYLNAYLVRWTPSRALSYYWFLKSSPYISEKLDNGTETSHILGIGAGAGAEVVALGSLSYANNQSMNVKVVDTANWKSCLDRLKMAMETKWHKPENTSHYDVDFIHKSIFDAISDIELDKLSMIINFFTINELFAESIPKTMHLLSKLSACSKGCLLIFIGSPGSYSDIRLKKKKYPIRFFLQYSLTDKDDWKLVDSKDSEWFRIPEGLKYPLKMENMRYFYQIYQKQ